MIILIGAVAISLFLGLFFSLQAGVFGLFFTTLAWWSWLNPKKALLLFIVAAPILPALKITSSIETITLAKDVIIFALFFKLFLIPLLTKKLPYRRNPLWLGIGLLLLWVGIGVLKADVVLLGILRARDIVLFVMLYFAVLYLPRSNEKPSFEVKAFLALIATGMITVVTAGYQWFFAHDSAVLRFDPERAIWIPRIASTLGHPSIYGQFLVIVLLALFAYILFFRHQLSSRVGVGGERARSERRDKRGETIRWRKAELYLSGIGILVGGLLVFLTYSRGVWIGLVVGVAAMLAYIFLQQDKVRRLLTIKNGIMAIVLLVVLGIGINFSPTATFIRTTIDPTYASNAERLEFAARLVGPMTNAEAITGRGLGDVITQQFRAVSVTTTDIVSSDADTIQTAKNQTLVDNQYLKTFVELGLAGILIYFFIYWKLGAALWQKGLSTMTVFGMGFLAFFVVQGLFIDVWEIFPTNAAFWVIAGLLARNRV